MVPGSGRHRQECPDVLQADSNVHAVLKAQPLEGILGAPLLITVVYIVLNAIKWLYVTSFCCHLREITVKY